MPRLLLLLIVCIVYESLTDEDIEIVTTILRLRKVSFSGLVTHSCVFEINPIIILYSLYFPVRDVLPLSNEASRLIHLLSSDQVLLTSYILKIEQVNHLEIVTRYIQSFIHNQEFLEN